VLAVYIRLLFAPISLEYFNKQLNQIAIDTLPVNFSAKLGTPTLSLENAIVPVIKFSPVVIENNKSRAKIEMEAINLGFSPIKSLFGNPSVNVAFLSPTIKIVQDLHGPRFGDFEFVEGSDGNNAVIWVLEGENSYPSIDITALGLDVSGDLPHDSGFEFRSDNDLIIANFKAIEGSLAEFDKLIRLGKISKFSIQGGEIDMHDSVYGVLRQYSKIDLVISASLDKKSIVGSFSTEIAGRLVLGGFERKKEKNDIVKLSAEIKNIDFSSVFSFLDDPRALIALKGAGRININVDFDKAREKVLGGFFDVDPYKSKLRIQQDYFPLEASEFRVTWFPDEAKLLAQNTFVKVGDSYANVEGEFYLGLDDKFGSTLSMLIKASDVIIHPSDLDAPNISFDSINFSGWSAPLYGAVGIDQIIAQKPNVTIWAKGRADMLQKGMGLNIEVGGQNASVDDLKRLWPYFIATSGRDWFVENVKQGVAKNISMQFNFPPGSLEQDQDDMILPKNAIQIDILGHDVQLIPWKNMDILGIDGNVNVKILDYKTTATMEAATLRTNKGPVNFTNGAIIIDGEKKGSNIFELSSDISGDLPALIALGEVIMPDELEKANIPLDIDNLNGKVETSLLATFVLHDDEEMDKVDYAANGTITEFSSSDDIGGYSFENGNFRFALSHLGYNFNGAAQIASFDADVSLEGTLNGEQNIRVASVLDVEQMKELGFEASGFLAGSAQFIVDVLADGSLLIAANIKDMALNIVDLGVSKARGIDGHIKAKLSQSPEITEITQIDLSFDDVKIKGDLLLDNETGFKSANFPVFALSSEDKASLFAQPIDGGIEIKIDGERMDLKPMLRRSFALDQPSTGGVKSSQYQDVLLLDIKLKQAIGFYGVVANNFNLAMNLKGSDLRKVSLQTQFSQGNSVSIVTNPVENGRTMSVAFDDAGTLLRFLNIYSRLLGGKGSLSMTTDLTTNIDNGVLNIANFSLIDESKIADIIAQDRDSRKLIANENRINFKYGKAQFIRTKENIEIIDGVIDGGEVGGTLRGFIHTKDNEYDLTGTYIPLFGLNSIFQKIPLFGVILGGREGEGLIGVTFAVRGNLNDPEFIINPVSILAPGMFRSLFEFRAREAPVAQ